MRSLLVFIISVACSLLFLSTAGKRERSSLPEAVRESRWTGSISFEEKFTGLTGTSERTVTVTFNNALPTLHRNDPTTDLDFTDDKGTGTVVYHAEGIIGGKKVGYTDCSGGGKSELHEVVVDEVDNSYRIHAIGPACNGQTVSLLDGKVDPYGPEYTDIIISDEPLTDKNNLAGSTTKVVDMGGNLGTVTRTTTWRLFRLPSDLVFIVTPENYDTWLPEPGKDESKPGNTINISFKLQTRNGGPPPVKATEFQLRLLHTSREPGISLNYPVNNPKTTPDLQFQWQMLADTSQEAQRLNIHLRNPAISGNARIVSFDGGGYTTLEVIAILDDNTEIRGSLLVPNGEELIRIPKRNPGDNIGTAWLNRYGDPGESDDNENFSGNSRTGDGLSAYEEYRGVISETEFPGHPNKFGRLDPKKKEMGVRLKKTEIAVFNQGMSLFQSATDIKVVRFTENEIGTDRRFNKNGGTAHSYDQYVQKLEKGTCGGDAVGENQPIHVTGKIPKLVDKVVIDITKIQQNYQRQQAGLTASNRRMGTNIRMPYTQAEEIANTVAHELAHGIGVDHHGLPSDEPNKVIPPPHQTADIFHIYGSDGVEIIRTRPYPIEGVIGLPHNDASGDLSCIMAYTSLYQWVYRVGLDGSLNYYAVPLLPVGKKLCTSNTCTAPCINANDRYFSNTRSGNCASRLKLKD